MPNPEQIIAAARVGAELVESTAPQLAAKLPGLIELCGPAAPKMVSILEPETRALLEGAASETGHLAPSAPMHAAEKSGVPLAVDPGRIAAVRESLLGGSAAEIDKALSSAFTPRTYAERMAFYGG